jgi:hypothetical protein
VFPGADCAATLTFANAAFAGAGTPSLVASLGPLLEHGGSASVYAGRGLGQAVALLGGELFMAAPFNVTPGLVLWAASATDPDSGIVDVGAFTGTAEVGVSLDVGFRSNTQAVAVGAPGASGPNGVGAVVVVTPPMAPQSTDRVDAPLGATNFGQLVALNDDASVLVVSTHSNGPKLEQLLSYTFDGSSWSTASDVTENGLPADPPPTAPSGMAMTGDVDHTELAVTRDGVVRAWDLENGMWEARATDTVLDDADGVDISGDVLVVGQPHYGACGGDAGRLAIYSRAGFGTNWRLAGYVASYDPTPDALVGAAVALRGGHLVSAGRGGTVTSYETADGDAARFAPRAFAMPPSNSASFGASVAVELNANEVCLAVGDPADPGSVYVYEYLDPP